MKCENCNISHNGEYGSGRFCSKKCSKSFSTKNKRSEINEKVSKKLSGRPIWNNAGFTKGADKRRHVFTNEDRLLATIKRIDAYPLEKLKCKGSIRRRLLKQITMCEKCNISDWNGKELIFELHHIDGNKNNNVKNNLQILCPNCHSQTDTFRNKKRI